MKKSSSELLRLDVNVLLAIATAASPREAARPLAGMVADSRHVYLDPLPSPAAEDWHDALSSLLGTASCQRLPAAPGGRPPRRPAHLPPPPGKPRRPSGWVRVLG